MAHYNHSYKQHGILLHPLFNTYNVDGNIFSLHRSLGLVWVAQDLEVAPGTSLPPPLPHVVKPLVQILKSVYCSHIRSTWLKVSNSRENILFARPVARVGCGGVRRTTPNLPKCPLFATKWAKNWVL